MNYRINCVKCSYFHVTWDKHKPNGCRAFGFKSKLLPSLVVYQSSGKRCLHYAPKAK